MGTLRATMPTHPCPEYLISGHGAQLENPALLSPLLASLFPPGVTCAELGTPADPSMLYAAEAQDLGFSMRKRAEEFTAGRLCARRALANLGISRFPLRVNPDQRPQWPAPIVGSITHTTGMCGAVVAERRLFRSIGVDMEIVGNVTREIWPYICTSEEIAWLTSLPEPQQMRCAALVFSAKEAFYKCQFGATTQWMEFHDVGLNIASTEWAKGRFALQLKKGMNLLDHGPVALTGRFQFSGNLVVTGVVLEAG